MSNVDSTGAGGTEGRMRTQVKSVPQFHLFKGGKLVSLVRLLTLRSRTALAALSKSVLGF